MENPGDSMSKHAEKDHVEDLKVSDTALHQGMKIILLREARLSNFPQFQGCIGIEKSSQYENFHELAVLAPRPPTSHPAYK